MGFTREDIKNAQNKEEREELEWLLGRYLKCDEWAKKALLPVAVLLTSHPGNRAFLKASVESHKKLGYWICLAYDNYLDPNQTDLTPNDVLPDRDVLDQVDCFIMPHHQDWGGVLYPYFWLIKWGWAVLRDFKYIYCANGDCVLERPKNFPKMLKMIGDADILGCGWEDNGPTFNTAVFIAKSSALKKIIKHIQKYFIPFENYEKYTMEMGNCEARFARAILDLKLKQVQVEAGFNEQFHLKGYGKWYKIVGFRHIHGELGYAYKNRLKPPELEYYDPRHMSNGEYNILKEYWEKKDKKILERWWAK